MALTLDLEQFTALVSLARKGAATPDEKRVLETFIRSIETANGIKRYLLLVQWQESDTPLPPTTRFPEVWPPELRALIELEDRPVAKADVVSLLGRKARKPVNVFVTKDPGGIVGWSKIEDFFIT